MTLTPEMAPRTDHSYQLYDAAFGDIIHRATTIADVGAGDSEFAEESRLREGKSVLRIDAQYDRIPPKGDDYLAADARHMPQVPDNSFDVALSAFTMQHIQHGNGDAARVVKEMVRITNVDTGNGEFTGYVALFPVWRPSRLNGLLGDFNGVAGIGFPNPDKLDGFTSFGGSERLSMRDLPTLVIHKTPTLTPDRLDALAELIERSGAMTKRRNIGDMARRAIISTTGETRRPVRPRGIAI